jgi:hypothetical protein
MPTQKHNAHVTAHLADAADCEQNLQAQSTKNSLKLTSTYVLTKTTNARKLLLAEIKREHAILRELEQLL